MPLRTLQTVPDFRAAQSVPQAHKGIAHAVDALSAARIRDALP
jgi:hypothetical protein